MGSRWTDSLGDASRRLASILLYDRAFFSDSRNETTATAESMGGHTMAISFWMADPPDISFFSVVCAKPPNPLRKVADFKVLPHVVGAEGRFVFLRARFFSRYGKDEHFMYKAGDSPSLEFVPLPPDDDDALRVRRVRDFGIVPCGHGGHYLLAALCNAPSDYQLHIYSSERKAWSSKILCNPCPGAQTIVPEKVITLGEGVLGWVDFSHGVLVCDLRLDHPVVSFIPLPGPLPENRDKLKASAPGAPARWFRDLTCVNGVLKLIEMEHRIEVTEKPEDPSDKDLLYDSDLITSLEHKDMDEKPKSRECWRAVTWCRTVPSNCWRKGCTVGVADILIDESTRSSLLSGVTGETVGKGTFNDLHSAFPTLSVDGDDIVFLKSVLEPSDQHGWIVAVDLVNKTVKALGAYSSEDMDINPSKHAFRPCTLSRHLKMTPGTEVSACCMITEACLGSANDPNNTSIRVCEPSSSEERIKYRRLVDEKISRALNEAKRVKNDHVSRVDPVPNNLQCFNKLDGPVTLVMHRRPQPLTYMAMSTINRCGSSHHH